MQSSLNLFIFFIFIIYTLLYIIHLSTTVHRPPPQVCFQTTFTGLRAFLMTWHVLCRLHSKFLRLVKDCSQTPFTSLRAFFDDLACTRSGLHNNNNNNNMIIMTESKKMQNMSPTNTHFWKWSQMVLKC